LVVPQEPEAPAQEAKPAECRAGYAHHRPGLLRLLKRVFEIDMEHCPNCGGELKIIAAILEAPVIEKILTQLGKAGACIPLRRLPVAKPCKRPEAAQSGPFRRPSIPGW
jgi:hypothetical protein